MTFVTFKKFLLEMPMIVGDTDFGLDEDALNRKTAQRLMGSKEREELDELRGGFALYRVNQTYFVLYKDEPKLYYMMTYVKRTIRTVAEIASTQIAVWASSYFTLSVAKLVFYEHLLPDHHLIATDSTQTRDGARFWKNRAAEALDKNLWLYFIDEASTPRRMIRITDAKRYSDLAPEIWGRTMKFKARKLLISDKQLYPVAGVDLED